MLPGREGDCFWVEYGNEDDLNYIMIDGGRQLAYDYLKPRIIKLNDKNHPIELALLTHVDADHIEGILKLVEEEEFEFNFKDFWFNGYHHLDEESFKKLDVDSDEEDFGAVQGERLSKALIDKKWPWNEKFNRGPVVINDEDSLPVTTLEGGMKITLLSPDWKMLNKMKKKWKKEVEKAGMVPGVEIPEEEPITDDEESFGALTIEEVKDLASLDFKKDTSAANGSSIAFIAEYENKRVLFAGDAHADILSANLKKLLDQQEEKVQLDAFKVSHHGSRKTLNNEVLKCVDCENYLISSNGSRHGHPDTEAIARILMHGGERKNLYFNYSTKYTDIWDSKRLKRKFKYDTIFPDQDENGILTFSLISG